MKSGWLIRASMPCPIAVSRSRKRLRVETGTKSSRYSNRGVRCEPIERHDVRPVAGAWLKVNESYRNDPEDSLKKVHELAYREAAKLSDLQYQEDYTNDEWLQATRTATSSPGSATPRRPSWSLVAS